MRLQRISSGLFALVLLVLGANALLLVLITRAYDDVVAAQEHRRVALALSSDLQRETEQLARMVRAFTATGETRYLLYYYDILGARQGEKSAPVDAPAGSYWDDVVAGRRAHVDRRDGPRRSLAERMRSLGFGEQELAALRRVLDVTASMNEVEQKAFAATQGLYDPDTDRYVSDGTPRQDYATELVHSATYNALKADQSEAVDTLFRMLDQRTGGQVAAADRALSRYLVLSLAAMALTIVLAVLALRGLRRSALMPIARLGQATDRLATGDYSTRVGALSGFEELGALGRTVDTMAEAIEDDIARRGAVQAELEAARQQAEQATRAKSRFLAHMSHEIRTPMNAILGMAYLAQRSGLDPRQKDYVDKIHDAARALLEVVNDLLDLSKVEAGRLELAHTPFQIEQVVRDALWLVRQPAVDKGLELVCQIGDAQLIGPAGAFVGDPVRLGQVLTNLLANAVRFTDHGHVALAVSRAARADGRTELRFEVRDTGIGLSPDQAARLFEDFAQADSAVARAYGGTGLGLAIARRIVEYMDGRIGVDSVEGRGTVFHAAVALASAPQPLPNPVPVPALRRQRVLVVDPSQVGRAALSAQLAALGCGPPGGEVCAVATGGEARAALEDAWRDGRPFDHVLLDPGMPGNTAFDRLDAVLTGPAAVAAHRLSVISLQDAPSWRDVLAARGVLRWLPQPVLPSALAAHLLAQGEGAAPTGHGAATPAAADGLAGLRVLLVEDNPVNRQVASELLVGAGMAVVSAEHGLAALDILAAPGGSAFDLVLLDLQMPVMDGYTFMHRLRADPMHAALPVIALSAHALVDERARCLAMGMQAHLSKPIDPEALFACLHAVLTGRQPAARRVEPVDGPTPDAHATAMLQDQLRALSALMRAGDNAARAQWKTVRDRLVPHLSEARCRRIEQALARFDFDAAADALDEAGPLPPAVEPAPGSAR